MSTKSGKNSLSYAFFSSVVGYAVTCNIALLQRNLRNLTSEECAIFLSGGDPSALSDAPDGIHRALLLQHSKILHPDSIQIVDTGRGKLLGVGDYSMVYRGTYNSMPVVVKNVESNVNVEEFKAILAEVKTMAYVGDHKNILKFWGAEVLAIKKRKDG